MTQDHVRFEYNGNFLTNLEKYNDATPYRVTETLEKKLLEDEVNRLVRAVRHTKPLLFHFDCHDIDPATGLERLLTYQEVNHVIKQLGAALAVVSLDNACISVAHCSNQLSETASTLESSRASLTDYYGGDTSNGPGCRPKQLQPPRRNAVLFMSLVDFLTGTLARIFSQTATGGHWLETMLSILASIAMKVKVLAADLPAFALTSIEMASSVMAVAKETMEDRRKETITIVIDAKKSKKSELQMAEQRSNTKNRYHDSKTLLGICIIRLLKLPLSELTIDNKPTTPDSFENHCALYRTLSTTKSFVVYSGRDSMVMAGQAAFDVDFAQQLMLITQGTIDEIVKLDPNYERDPASPNRPTSEWGVSVGPAPDTWTVRIRCGKKAAKEPAEAEVKPLELYARSVEVAVSVILPLWIGQGLGPLHMRRLVTMTMSLATDDDPVIMFDAVSKYSAAYVTVTSKDWNQKQRAMTDKNDSSRDHTLRLFAHSPWQQRLLGNNCKHIALCINTCSRNSASSDIHSQSTHHPNATGLEIGSFGINSRSSPRTTIAKGRRWKVGRSDAR
jgi:hypothetical protein